MKITYKKSILEKIDDEISKAAENNKEIEFIELDEVEYLEFKKAMYKLVYAGWGTFPDLFRSPFALLNDPPMRTYQGVVIKQAKREN